jgi:L-ascorbate metabolism protein UlaG (beta-lactamase superfamily)
MVYEDDLKPMEYSLHRKRYQVSGHGSGGGLVKLMKWQFGSRPAKWPTHIENADHPPPPAHASGENLSATWIGHSTVLLQTAGVNILTDPFLATRASPFTHIGPKRVRKPGLSPREMPPIDIVLISHNHYDHLDKVGLKELLKFHKPLFLMPVGNRKYLRSLRPDFDMRELDWRESVQFGNVRFTAMPALHWSKRTFDDANQALWCAFAIESPGGSIYFAGDTGYGEGATFREVRERFGAPRLSLLPIGAYEPRWFMKPMHMNPEEAVQAHLHLGSRTSLAIHHGTIQLTNEPIDQPVNDLAAALKQHEISPGSFLVPDIGQTVQIL